MNKFLDTLKLIGAIIAITGLIIGITYSQFKVYQKKYGDHMTFFDFLIDAETNN